MIDSGSSRSNVYLYEWPGEKENETGVVTEIDNCRVPGESLSLQQEEHIAASVCTVKVIFTRIKFKQMLGKIIK